MRWATVGACCRPGRFNQLEFGVHNFNNWLLSRVIDGPVWDPGKRVYVGGDMWSNDDERLLSVVAEAEKALEENRQ